MAEAYFIYDCVQYKMTLSRDGQVHLIKGWKVLGQGVWRGTYVFYSNEMSLDWNVLDVAERHVRKMVKKEFPELLYKDMSGMEHDSSGDGSSKIGFAVNM